MNTNITMESSELQPLLEKCISNVINARARRTKEAIDSRIEWSKQGLGKSALWRWWNGNLPAVVYTENEVRLSLCTSVDGWRSEMSWLEIWAEDVEKHLKVLLHACSLSQRITLSYDAIKLLNTWK